jgi:hypothetical protein
MNLSRAAKKFRTLETKSAKPVTSKKPETRPEPTVKKAEAIAEQVAPVIELAKPVVVAPPPKVWPVKQKRTRFVREKAERRERTNLPPLASSQNFFTRLMTQNLAVPPKDEPVKLSR